MEVLRKYHLILIALIYLISVPLAYGIEPEDTERAPDADISSADNQGASSSEIDIPVVAFEKSEGAPLVDGLIDDDFWHQAKRFELDLELYPERFGKPVVETFAYIAVTNTHIFIAFDARDPEPEKIRSIPRNRDAVKEDDFVSLIVDPTGVGVKKYELRVNPHGSLTDVLQDTVSDRYIYDWDTKWTGAAQISQTGYSAEIAIPLQSIRFPDQVKAGSENWQIMLKRSYPRSVDRTFAKPILVTKANAINQDIDLAENSTKSVAIVDSIDDKSATSTQKLDQADTDAQEVLPGAEAEEQGSQFGSRLQNIKFTPYYIYHKDEERDLGEEFEQVEEHGLNEVGFTSSFHFGTDQTVGLTVNPNFTEVEADIARESINNPFTAFQPEKREFFHEGGELYNTLIPTVYTRNIVSPILGLSYSQAGTRSSGGFFWTSDRETEVIMPDNLGSDKVTLLSRSESAAARFQTSFGKNTTGLMFTMRMGEDDYHNYVGGIDGVFNLGIDDKMRYQLLYSDTQYTEAFADDLCEDGDCTTDSIPDYCPLGSCGVNPYVLRSDYDENLTGHALRLNYKHDGPNHLYWINYYNVAPDFRADLGFARRTDVNAVDLAYGKKWYLTMPGDDGKSRIRGYAVARSIDSHGGEQIERSVSMFGELRGWRQTVLRGGYALKERAVNRVNQNSLELGDNAPLFDEGYWLWYSEFAPTAKWTFHFDGKYGEMANADNLILGDMREFKPRLYYRLNGFEFRAEAVMRNFDVYGGELFEERFYTLGVNYRRTKKVSHRLLYLDDATKRDLDLWVIDEPEKETENSVEYTLVYTPNNAWAILSGVKFGWEGNSDDGDSGRTEQEIFFKIERKINAIF